MEIDRMAAAAFVAFGILLCAGCGARDGEVPKAFAQRMDTIRASLMRGGSGFPHLQEFEATDRLFDEMPEGVSRRAAATAFGEMLLSLDFSALPYRMRESATSLYAQYVCQCFKGMVRCGLSTRTAIESFFRGLGLYRDSCLTVPIVESVDGETLDETRARLYCARILRQDYEVRMSIFEQIWLPNLSRYLPPEFHDEFRRRLRAFELPPSRPASPPTAQSSGAGGGR